MGHITKLVWLLSHKTNLSAMFSSITENILGECCYYLRNYNFICLCVKLKPFPFHQAVTQSEDTIVQETLRAIQESPAQTLKTVLSNVLEIPRKAALLGHSGHVMFRHNHFKITLHLRNLLRISDNKCWLQKMTDNNQGSSSDWMRGPPCNSKEDYETATFLGRQFD